LKTVSSKNKKKNLKPIIVRPLETAVDLASIRQRITGLVANRAAEMVEATIDSATEGQYAAMRYLFEMIGLFPATMQPEAESENVIPNSLFRELTEMAGMKNGVAEHNASKEKVDGMMP
jgi:hypothetical protein